VHLRRLLGGILKFFKLFGKFFVSLLSDLLLLGKLGHSLLELRLDVVHFSLNREDFLGQLLPVLLRILVGVVGHAVLLRHHVVQGPQVVRLPVQPVFQGLNTIKERHLQSVSPAHEGP
jgi:hypothetical protein